MGPTASGKTPLAERLAAHYDAELVNADAFQVYRGLDIGTAKPSDRERYHLLDILNPDQGFGVGEWVRLASLVLQDAFERSRNVIVVGGTGLYIRALFEGYAEMAEPPDPELRTSLERREASEGLPSLALDLWSLAPEIAARTDLKNPARVRRALERLASPPSRLAFEMPAFKKRKIAIIPDKELLETRISARIFEMVQNGWVREVQGLRDAGYLPEHPGFRAIGYRSIWDAMVGATDLDQATATTIVETRRYAKRQRTWLRSEPELNVLSLGSGGSSFDATFDQARAIFESEV